MLESYGNVQRPGYKLYENINYFPTYQTFHELRVCSMKICFVDMHYDKLHCVIFFIVSPDHNCNWKILVSCMYDIYCT